MALFVRCPVAKMKGSPCEYCCRPRRLPAISFHCCRLPAQHAMPVTPSPCSPPTRCAARSTRGSSRVPREVCRELDVRAPDRSDEDHREQPNRHVDRALAQSQWPVARVAQGVAACARGPDAADERDPLLLVTVNRGPGDLGEPERSEEREEVVLEEVLSSRVLAAVSTARGSARNARANVANGGSGSSVGTMSRRRAVAAVTSRSKFASAISARRCDHPSLARPHRS